MPTWPNAAAFAADLERVQREINREDSLEATLAMAKFAEETLTSEASRDLGGDTRFSGWRGRDLADLRIKQARRRGNGHWIFPTRKSGGPWKVAEQGRNQGDVRGRGGSEIFIGPSINRETGETFRTKKGNVRRTSYRRTAKWSGYTRGKKTASRAIPKIEREAERIAEKAIRDGLSKRFDVS